MGKPWENHGNMGVEHDLTNQNGDLMGFLAFYDSPMIAK